MIDPSTKEIMDSTETLLLEVFGDVQNKPITYGEVFRKEGSGATLLFHIKPNGAIALNFSEKETVAGCVMLLSDKSTVPFHPPTTLCNSVPTDFQGWISQMRTYYDIFLGDTENYRVIGKAFGLSGGAEFKTGDVIWAYRFGEHMSIRNSISHGKEWTLIKTQHFDAAKELGVLELLNV